MQKTVDALKKNEWDDFILKYGPRSGLFLQSWNWGEFQKSVGEMVERIAWMSDSNETVAIAQAIHKSISKFGSYTYIPRGPIFLAPSPFEGEGGGRGVALEGDVSHSLSKNDLFIRFEPDTLGRTKDLSHALSFERRGVTLKTLDLQPAHTLITDLFETEEQLLANMHEKTRYNIRLADKKGVKIEIGTVSIDDVWPVFEMTSSRDEFRLHGKEYYKRMLETPPDLPLAGEEDVHSPLLPRRGWGRFRVFLAIAKHENDILAANIMIDFGDTRTYLHGASSNVKRNLMGPFLLHWELMKDAKAKGIRFYDWWGVAPVDASSDHAWSGISRFKRGFGGEEVEYPGTFDLVMHPIMYKLYQFIRTFRRGMKK